jgi:hypothetical protein
MSSVVAEVLLIFFVFVPVYFSKNPLPVQPYSESLFLSVLEIPFFARVDPIPRVC